MIRSGDPVDTQPRAFPPGAALLAHVHEARVRHEAAHASRAGGFGVDLAAFGARLTAARAPRFPQSEALNTVTGFTPSEIAALPDILAWSDAAGAPTFLRTDGADVVETVSRPVAALGFAPVELEAWHWAAPRELAKTEAQPDPRVAIEDATQDARSRRDWVEAVANGWGYLGERRAVFAAATAPESPPAGWRYVLARVEGAPAGGALVCLSEDGVGYCGIAGVDPRFRGAGLQRRLLEARARIASEAGAAFIAACARWGSPSYRNMLAVGLAPAHLSLLWRRPGRGEAAG